MDTNQPIDNKGIEPKQPKKPWFTTTRIAIFAVVLIAIIGSISIITKASPGTFFAFLNGSVGINSNPSAEITPIASLASYAPFTESPTPQFATTPTVTAVANSRLTTSKAMADKPLATAEPSATTASQEAINVSALNATNIGWAFGTAVDTLNRPKNAVNSQTKYSIYNADFIKESNKKVIYLTFDEGYENGYSAQILNTLYDKKVPAVFFVTEPYAKNNPTLVRRMVDEGHVIGNHSVTHPSAGIPSLSIHAQINEIVECHNYIKAHFGYTAYLFRFPNGKYSEQSLAIVKNCNYRSVFWSFAYRDWDVANQMNETVALDQLTSHLHPGAIYLLHAVSKTNTNILGDFIDKARAKGYEFAFYSK